eukprot:18332_1
MATTKHKKAKLTVSKSNKKPSKQGKTPKPTKKKRKRAKIKKSMTTDDLDKIAKTAVSFKNIKNKKLKISTPKKIQSTKDIKSKSSRKSPRKLKRCVAVTTNIHNKSIADNYKKKSKRILTEHNTPITKKKNSKSQHK